MNEVSNRKEALPDCICLLTNEIRNCYSGGRMIKTPRSLEIQIWPIERFIPYARNPRRNDAAVDRMCASIREFGFKVPVLARSDGTVVDGHLYESRQRTS